jgi:integrase
MQQQREEFFLRKRPDGSFGDVYWTYLFGRRVTTGCKTLRLARAWKEAKLLEGANPRFAAAKRARLDDAVREILAELGRRGRRPKTIEKVEKKLGHYPRLWGVDRKLVTIDMDLVNAYVDKRLTEPGTGKARVKRITIRDELGALRQLLKHARRRGLYPFAIEDVLPDRFETGHKPRTDFVPFDELWRLFGALREHRRAHLLFFCVTGGRTADSFRALREDFDLKAGTILVRGSKTDGSYRTIPIPEFLQWHVRLLLELAPGEKRLFEPWSEGSMNRDIKAACARVGLAPVSTNGLRRTFGHALRMHGYTLDVISRLFGHTTEKLARDVYADFSVDELAERVKRQGKSGADRLIATEHEAKPGKGT